jgi:hypothetical protein
VKQRESSQYSEDSIGESQVQHAGIEPYIDGRCGPAAGDGEVIGRPETSSFARRRSCVACPRMMGVPSSSIGASTTWRSKVGARAGVIARL